MSFKIKGHPHRVSLVKNHDGLECDACDQSYGDAYSCGECKFTVHKKCTFLFEVVPEIFEHPSHVGHCLKLLTTGAPDHTVPKCHLCGKNTKRLLYHCRDCKLNVDIDCIIDPMCAQADLNMPWHHHPLFMGNFATNMTCDVCYDNHVDGYICLCCRLFVGWVCAALVIDSPEITHPCHTKHPLKLLTEGAPTYTDPKCHLCGEDTGKFIYHCDICKFNLDLVCAKTKTPPVALSNLKVHEHTLNLMPRLISFVCDACGTKGDRAPYVCHQCDFMVHKKCAHLPRVINVNHHDHRVSFKYPLGLGEWRCGVCFEEIDWSCGAYSCSLCPQYAIHSLCATRKDVWNGKELDGVPEEVEDIEPFKRNDDNTITHFAHEHNLMSLSKDGEESSLCGACVLPIGSYTFYKCSKSNCSFILHEKCANISKKKRHFLSSEPLILCFESIIDDDFLCRACYQMFCEGFFYSSKGVNFDLICSSITMPFIHGSHDHHLLYVKQEEGNKKTCHNCDNERAKVLLGCIKCNYFLDFRCATMPLTIMLPRYDDHPLTLCYGEEKASGKYWCDICERETNPETWFYTCNDCGVTLHTFCVLGDIRNAKAGGSFRHHGELELLPNNRSTRPLCNSCHSRCPGSFIMKSYDGGEVYCSCYCVSSQLGYTYKGADTCPPWAIYELELIVVIHVNYLSTYILHYLTAIK
ncbi:putative protein [Arabidopsis thaliana]|uniref:Cysteine/Histidine-rich C1 domain family protein n=1 Tax=Arabidopsis thaliana TaxID=3702 RepID=Q9M1F4_ARATH|nr:Cysteine/Histidine-rich C1 domain family protein [Arabidopsis thaliana]AEE78040.1 Cysteine/Histidine-rich C1 domain family protein [Arabidopsis thaliana]CAB75482.1 putative protein [Arabidopsis thaliana]|eukprot:NP_190139.1 Cysteine/Histidine-rich C1 domain family protein [Arabidopsis thaliana]